MNTYIYMPARIYKIYKHIVKIFSDIFCLHDFFILLIISERSAKRIKHLFTIMKLLTQIYTNHKLNEKTEIIHLLMWTFYTNFNLYCYINYLSILPFTIIKNILVHERKKYIRNEIDSWMSISKTSLIVVDSFVLLCF